ncbi:MAG: hypothetical protein IT228_10890 [Flavobacteriales bacterium]|nr:hypothetical protein [Flavobacteriales bacterium]MCC6577837.1 hypothetical protein [Flavobacteriales bacterium]NUQ15510.1 hypothetical protein [Flavobacteriales bacterium]
MRNDAATARVASAIAVVCALGVGSTGCRKDAGPARWDVDVLAPLVNTSLTIGDLVADSLLVEGDAGELSLLYRTELFGIRLDTLLQVPDTGITYSYVLPVPGPLFFAAGALLPTDEDATALDLEGVQLRTLAIRSGQLEVALTNMIASGIHGTFALPGATFNGQPVAVQGAVPAGSPQTPSATTLTRDLAGHWFDLRGPAFDQVNALHSQVTIQLDPNGAGANVTNMDSVKAVATYSDIVPQYAEGYFGNRVEQVGPEHTELDLFDRITHGLLDIDQAEARIRISNGVGADLRIRIHELVSENTRTGTEVPLTGPLVGVPINLTRALDLGGSFQPTVWNATLHTGNSSIAPFVENLPDRLRYAMDLELNPLGDVSNGHDFLYYESAISARLELEMPLRLIATDLTVERTLTPDLPGTAEGHGLTEGTLTLFATNGFPFRARLLLDILDANGAVAGVIPVVGEVASGEVDPDGLVRDPVRSTCTASLSPALVDLLYTGLPLRVRAVFNTADQAQHLPLMAHYRLDLQVVAGVNHVVNGDE